MLRAQRRDPAMAHAKCAFATNSPLANRQLRSPLILRYRMQRDKPSANYDYVLEPTDDGTRITLDARCRATGPWRLIHPLIVFAMKRSDGDQLAKLRRVVESALA